MAQQLVCLDGNYLEGGGQIVRTALALSALAQRPFRVSDIRKGRDKPGLKQQHLTALQVLTEWCNADVEGSFLGSGMVRFIPRGWKPKSGLIDIGTAGSITLLLQSLLPPLLFGSKKIKLELMGGTDTAWAMPIDYFQHVLVPVLRKYADIQCTVLKRGYYPKGGGLVELSVKPKYELNDAPPIVLESFQHIVQIRGLSHASKDLQTAEVAERQAKTAELALRQMKAPVQVSAAYYDTLSTGSGIAVWALCSKTKEFNREQPIVLGADMLGEKGKPAEQVGLEAAEKLLAALRTSAPVDVHGADNLIPYLGLCGGELTTSVVSKHTLTNVYTVEKFIGKKIVVDGNRIVRV